MDRESLCKEYEKLSMNSSDYRKFFDYQVDTDDEFYLIEYDEDLYEFNDETINAIKEYNKFVKLLNEKDLNRTEKSIIHVKLYKQMNYIRKFCYFDCKEYINFDSPERKQKRKEIKKKILEYLFENLE